MENLAPAGNREALERAIAAGADAVYLGYEAFGARASAGNFDAAGLREAVTLAHLHHVRVHVTVNTLVKDSELPALVDVLRLLREARVDALLVQDLGVLALCRQCVPEMAVHASTQMAIHNATGAAWCRKMGMRRVVLARECSLEEIRRAAQVPIEIEVFGHGAQCVAVSGECLFSSMVGGRSGNRGRCAQPCRLNYTYRGKQGAWLSPRDVCLRNDVPALLNAGVASLKTEGRLKRPEYVAVVAGSYRRAIDSAESGAFQPADKAEQEGLLQIFQRGGFMRGYAMGCEDAAVIEPARVDHGGLRLGRVQEVRRGMARVLLERPLHDGDQLRIEGEWGESELRYAGPETAAGATALLRLREGLHPERGDTVVRLADSAQLAAANAIPLPQIPVEMRLTSLPGERLTLTLTDGESEVTVTGEEVAPARTRAMGGEEIARSLKKTGDTAFVVTACEVRTENAFVPVSALNALRREGLAQLQAARCDRFAGPMAAWHEPEEVTLPAVAQPETLIFRHPSQLRAVPAGTRLVWRPEDYREPALREGLRELPEGIWLHLPTVCEEETLRMLHRLVKEERSRLGGVVLGSVGQLGLSWPVPVGAGVGIPVMNRRAAALLLREGCVFVTASPELTGKELAALCEGNPPVLIPAYGRTQLMLLHHCPARTYLGLSKGHAACALCEEGSPDGLCAHPTLIDRRGVVYPLLRERLPEGCRVRLLNTLPTDIRRRAAVLGCALLTELTDESAFADAGRGETTQGHWARPVE